jgi:hypothetical protein
MNRSAGLLSPSFLILCNSSSALALITLTFIPVSFSKLSNETSEAFSFKGIA